MGNERFNILLVDDEDVVLQEYKFVLAKEGYTLYLARSRQEAAPIIEQFRVDLRTPPADCSRLLALAVIDQN